MATQAFNNKMEALLSDIKANREAKANSSSDASSYPAISSPKTVSYEDNIIPDRPKRPLSAYNLFYRFKRDKLLQAYKSGNDSKEDINQLIMAVPGLEDYPGVDMPPEHLKELRRSEIRSVLHGDSLSPKDTRNRSHRKSHGALSFLEMNKVMVASWKSADDFSRSVFDELAEEGRRMYNKRVAEYEAKYPNSPPTPPKKKVKLSSPKKQKILKVEEPKSPTKDEVAKRSAPHDVLPMPTLPAAPKMANIKSFDFVGLGLDMDLEPLPYLAAGNGSSSVSPRATKSSHPATVTPLRAPSAFNNNCVSKPLPIYSSGIFGMNPFADISDNYSSSSSSELDDQLFSSVREEYDNDDASVDGFMDLIAKLG